MFANQDVTHIPIMHCFDNNFVIPAAVSFYSMLEHANPAYHYDLYVLHTDITSQNKKKLNDLVSGFSNASLSFIDMFNRFEDIWNLTNITGHLAKEVLYKLIAASIFPQYEKLVITDVDVVFLGDISESFFSFASSDPVYFAGVRHILPPNTWLSEYYYEYNLYYEKDSAPKQKICGGFLVMNLTMIRKDNMETTFLDYLKQNAYRLKQAEQDVINFCTAEEKIVYLPLNYVVCSYAYDLLTTAASFQDDPYYSAEDIVDALANPIQLHYATAIKPWNTVGSIKADIWFAYLGKTNFYEDYFQKKMHGSLSTERIPAWDSINMVRDKRSNVDISIICCTYNHEKYIRAALDGIINQNTVASFEVIVADDASTDNTQKVIREYCEKYPLLFNKCILREKNVGIGINSFEALSLAEGRYLAICDGDDAWIDTSKLQCQFELLEKNQEYMICCTSLERRQIYEESFIDSISFVDDYIDSVWTKKELYGFNDLLHCRFIASCTVLLRWRLKDCVPEWIKNYRTVDFALALLHSAYGPIYVMNDFVSARYSVHDKGLSFQSDYAPLQETAIIINEVNQYLGFFMEKNVQDFFASMKKRPEQPSISKKPLLRDCIYKKLSQIRFLKKAYGLFKESAPRPLKRAIRNILEKAFGNSEQSQMGNYYFTSRKD